jgi:hypothetical protein
MSDEEGDKFQPRTMGSLASSLIQSVETGQHNEEKCLTIEQR